MVRKAQGLLAAEIAFRLTAGLVSDPRVDERATCQGTCSCLFTLVTIRNDVAPVHAKGLTFFDQVETSMLEELADDATITKQVFTPLHIAAGEPWGTFTGPPWAQIL